MKAVRIYQNGGTDVLKYETDCPIPSVGKDTVRVRNKVIGVNFIDTYRRSGLYKVSFPFTLGEDGAGVIDAVGSDVRNFKPGDRVAYALQNTGSYAEFTSTPAVNAFKLPDNVSYEQGCAVMLQGLTAHYLLKDSYRVKANDTIFVHAAAGGMGTLLCQLGKHMGARVIGTTSSLEKAQVAKSAGCDEVILYTEKDFVAETKRLTDNKGVNVVYDSIGKDTCLKSMDILKPRGSLILYGNASGPPPLIDSLMLAAKGSLTVSRPRLYDFIATPEEFAERATEVFQWLESGVIKVQTDHKYPLDQVAAVHQLLESKKTTGKVLLLQK